MKLKVILVFMLAVLFLCPGCKKPREKKSISREGVTHVSYAIRCKGYRGEVTVKAGIEELFSYTGEPENISFLGGKIFKPVSETPPDITEVGGPIVLEASILSENFNLVVLPVKLVDEPDRKEIWMVIFGRISGVARIKMTSEAPNTRLIQDIYIEIPDSPVVSMAERLGVDKELCRGFDKGLARVQADFDPSLDPKELTSHGLRGEMYDTILQVHEASVWVNAGPEYIWEIASKHTNVEMAADMEYDEECVLHPGGINCCHISLGWAGMELKADTFSVDRLEEENQFIIYVTWLKQVASLVLELEPEAGGSELRLIFATEFPSAASPKIVDLMMTLAGLPKRIEKALLEIKAGVEGVG